jgi:hypothetical protein
MKKLFLILLFLVQVPIFPLGAQVTLFPEVEHRRRNDQTEIMRVEVNDTFTIVDFVYYPKSQSAEASDWACVDKATYITPSGRENRMFLIMAKEIPICPKMIKINPDAERPFIFHLYFPPIDKSILKIDIIGKHTAMRGVGLCNQADYPVADSAPFRSQDAFMRYFYAHRDSLDPIEGLWRLEVRRQHYMSNGTYLEEDKGLDPQVVAILRKGELFNSYDDTGLNRREYFKKLSGKKGYFFQSIFPEVEGEASAYTIFSGKDKFYLKYKLPDRLTHYYLLDRYLPGMVMVEIAQYSRIPLHEPGTEKPVFDLGKDTVKLLK